MIHKNLYVSPQLLRCVSVELEDPLLVGSVVTNSTTIESAGQKVEEHSFNDSFFESKWE